MTVLPKKKKISVHVRIDEDLLGMIDRAAQLQGKTRTDLIVEAATATAQDTFLDRTLFFLDDDRWEAFQKALDAEPVMNEKIQKMADFKAPWE
jgi:uncharacterized protein (DUF1778 family)